MGGDMLICYTGDGKGKTSACIGQAIRARGQGLSVVFAQFMKCPGIAGEQKILADMLGDNFRAGGKGFLLPGSDNTEHLRAARDLLAWIYLRLPAHVLILDEAICALGYGLLAEEDFEPFVTAQAGLDKHLILSGRNLPYWLAKKANYISEISSYGHPYDKGVPAIRGIDF